MAPSLEPSSRGGLEITDLEQLVRFERGEMEATCLGGLLGDAGESIEAYYAGERLRSERAAGVIEGCGASRVRVTPTVVAKSWYS